jgi:hypothetical protein
MSGGGGTCLPIVLKSWPTNPSGVQFGLAHAHELRGDPVGARGEHRADQAHDQVERAVLVGQVLGVALVELDRQLLGLGAIARLRDEVVGQIDPGDFCAGTRCRQGDLPRAARDVEHLDAGPERETVEKLEGARQQEGGEASVVARLPGSFQPGLQGAHFGGHRDVVHDGLLSGGGQGVARWFPLETVVRPPY